MKTVILEMGVPLILLLADDVIVYKAYLRNYDSYHSFNKIK